MTTTGRPSKELMDKVNKVSKQLADRGKLIEAGWESLKMTLSPDTSRRQINDMRVAFFCGAQYTFSSMVNMLEEGNDATEKDFKRMDSIHKELSEFNETLSVGCPDTRSSISNQEPEPQLGDQPIEEQHYAKMNAIARTLDEFFNGEDTENRKIGFVLLAFEFGDTPGRCNFISNGANRKDIVVLFKEMIARFSGQPDVVGHA